MIGLKGVLNINIFKAQMTTVCYNQTQIKNGKKCASSAILNYSLALKMLQHLYEHMIKVTELFAHLHRGAHLLLGFFQASAAMRKEQACGPDRSRLHQSV